MIGWYKKSIFHQYQLTGLLWTFAKYRANLQTIRIAFTKTLSPVNYQETQPEIILENRDRDKLA